MILREVDLECYARNKFLEEWSNITKGKFFPEIELVLLIGFYDLTCFFHKIIGDIFIEVLELGH